MEALALVCALLADVINRQPANRKPCQIENLNMKFILA
jgi:hypothetical protein